MPFTAGPNHSLMNRHYYDPHFTEEEAEAQRDELTCWRSHNQPEAEPGFEPRPVRTQSPRSKWEGVYVRALAGLCRSGSEAANLPQSHVDSDSSSSHSRQETPPTTAAEAPVVTVESASGFGPATPPQLRRSSAQVRPPTPSSNQRLPVGRQVPKWAGTEAAEGGETANIPRDG